MIIDKKRIMGLAVILFFFLTIDRLSSQCREQYSRNGTETLQGVLNNPDSYYRNLVIQDLGLANQQPFNEITIQFDYTIEFIVDHCPHDHLEISTLPVRIDCRPLNYRDFDISGSVNPEKADLVFHVVNHMGILTDSLIFFGIPAGNESGLYSLLEFQKLKSDGDLSVKFSRAVFYYTKKTYAEFRDRIMEVDRYYATSSLADSVLKWTSRGFLRETDTTYLLFLRKAELSRLIRVIQPIELTSRQDPGLLDPMGLSGRYRILAGLENRYRKLVEIEAGNADEVPVYALPEAFSVRIIEVLDQYHKMAYAGDFRDLAFLESLASPVLSNGEMFGFFNELKVLFPDAAVHRPVLTGFVYRNFFLDGIRYDAAGDQLRALKYFEAAYKIGILGGVIAPGDSLLRQICRIRGDVVNSYLEISRKALIKDNPVMSASYFRDALEIIDNNRFAACSEHSVATFEQWLFDAFLQRVRLLIAQGNYNKALDYLDEIQSRCQSSENVPCPPDLAILIQSARRGVYMEQLNKADILVRKDELPEAESCLQQAVDLRLRSGYAIPADPMEYRLEGIFRQDRYDNYIEEGQRNLNWEQPEAALYYFNKSFILENRNLPHPDPNLEELRQAAARQVILRMISDTRARALLFDFENFLSMKEQVAGMIADYKFMPDDSLVARFNEMEASATNMLCLKVTAEFATLLDTALASKATGNYILARKQANEAVEYSLSHLECMIDDSRAWYEKVVLEPLATYQEKRLGMTDYAGASPREYMNRYQDYSSYYYRHKLVNDGLGIESLYQLVLQSDDLGFLTRFLDQFISQQNFQPALDVLARMKTLGATAASVEEEQKELGKHLARRDVLLGKSDEPWKLLDGYVGREHWYNALRWSYKTTWISKTNGNFRYWPLIWKK